MSARSSQPAHVAGRTDGDRHHPQRNCPDRDAPEQTPTFSPFFFWALFLLEFGREHPRGVVSEQNRSAVEHPPLCLCPVPPPPGERKEALPNLTHSEISSPASDRSKPAPIPTPTTPTIPPFLPSLSPHLPTSCVSGYQLLWPAAAAAEERRNLFSRGRQGDRDLAQEDRVSTVQSGPRSTAIGKSPSSSSPSSPSSPFLLKRFHSALRSSRVDWTGIHNQQCSRL